MANADTGDGLCAECGSRLGGTLIPSIPIGTRIRGYEVLGTHGEDLVARAPPGQTVLLVLGSARLLALEADALGRFPPDGTLPALVEHGEDASYGPFLALSFLDASAPPLGAVARSLRVLDAIALARQTIDLVARIAREGFVWEPLPADFLLAPGGALLLTRLRCTGRIGEYFTDGNARPALEALGELLLPFPAALGPTSLVRLLAFRVTGTPSALSPEQALRAFVSVESELRESQIDAARPVAELSDVGLSRAKNEDAVAFATGTIARGTGRETPWTVLVACDGVAMSSEGALASSLAAKTTRDALGHFARSGDILYESLESAMSGAICAAHLALCATPWTPGAEGASPPGTTLVAALVFGESLVVGWVGDSRAYWVSPSGAELLTRDHSWVGESVVRGELTEAEAMASPFAHTLTRCLGPLELSGPTIEEVAPDVLLKTLSGAGHLVLCTDGLWNYFPAASDLTRVVRAAGPGATTPRIARTLVNHALARGGDDNVSVVVYSHPAPPTP